MSYDYALIKRNIERAIEIVTAQPEAKFRLAAFKSECGTIFCTAGLLFEDKEFRIQLEGTELGKTTKHRTANLLAHCGEMFGVSCYHRLFAEYFAGTEDCTILASYPIFPTDKTLALARLNRYLKELNHA